ncbi:MAG: hypothetical protein Kow0068_04430 [Marinilabiliales bacterium]
MICGCSDKNTFVIPEAEENLPDINIIRFDKDLFSLNVDSLENTLPDFYKKYNNFFDLFTHQIINIGGIEDQAFIDRLTLFLNDYLNRQVYDDCQKKYPDLKDIEKELSRALAYYKYYFPDKQIPEFYSYVSRFNQSIVVDEGFIGIGIDKYLGKDCSYYYSLGLPKYMINKMHEKMLPVDCMSALAISEFPFESEKNDLISNALYKAKIQYFLKSVFPYYHDTLLWGFNKSQLEWCNKNEKNMWSYLVEKKLFFSNDFMTIKRLTDDGPFTVPFTKESPARATVWLCYKIILSYIKNHQDYGLVDLMNENDYYKILNESKYEPD